MSYVVYRNGGNRKVEFWGSQGKITTREISKKEYETTYKNNRTGNRLLAYDTANLINEASANQEVSTAPVLVNPSTGKNLSPYEASGAAPLTDAKTGQTAYATLTITKTTPTPQAITPSKPPVNTISAAPKSGYGSVPSGKIGIARKEFVTGFFNRDTRGADYYRGDYSSKIGGAGFVLGRVAEIVGFSKIPQAYKGVTRPVVSAYASLFPSLSGGAAAGLGGFTTIVGAGYVVPKTVEVGGNLLTRATSQRTSTFIKTGQAEQAFQAGLNAEGLKGVKRYAVNIPVVNKLVPRDEQAFSSGVRQYGISQGIGDIQGLTQSARQRENIRTASLTASFLAANTLTEVQGAASLAKVVPKTSFWGKFGQSAPRIGLQGFFEGTAVTTAENTLTYGRVRDYNFKNIAAGGVTGALSAGTLGGVIYAARPAVSKTLLGAAYLTDPFEAAGDLTAGQAVKVPSFALTSSPATATSTVMPTTATEISSSPVAGVSSQTFVYTPSITTSTPVNTRTNSFINTRVFSNIFSPSLVSTNTRTSIIVNTPVSVNTPVNTPVSVNTPVNTPVNTFVSTPTPRLGAAPLLIGGGGFGGLKRGFDRIKQPRFYTPSLGASVLNIKGSMPSLAKIKTGLVVRPLI